MKIVYVVEDFPPVGRGGAAISTQEMAAHIGKSNDVVVFTPSYGRPEGITSAEHFRVFRYHNRFVPEGSLIQQKTLFFLEMTKNLSKFAREFEPDIIHAQNLMSAPAVANVSEIHKAIGVVHVRDHRFECFTSRLACKSHMDATYLDFARCVNNPLFSLSYPYAKFVTRAIRLAIKKCGRAFTVSDYLRQELLRRVTLDVRTSYIGVDLEKINAVRPMKQISGASLEKRTTIVYGGGFEKFKGIFELLEAFRHVRSKVKDVTLIVAGRGPDPRNALNSNISNLHLEDVIFLGPTPHEELLAIVKGSTLVVVPSLLPEAGSRATVEALACGRPILGSNKGCIPEIVGDAGLTFHPDPDSIANAILNVLGDEQKLETLSDRAKARSKIFDIRKTIPKVVQTYEEWLNN